MTKKHFIAFAELMRDYLVSANGHDEAKLVAAITRSMASEFADINPNFRFETFYEAVGLDGNGFLP